MRSPEATEHPTWSCSVFLYSLRSPLSVSSSAAPYRHQDSRNGPSPSAIHSVLGTELCDVYDLSHITASVSQTAFPSACEPGCSRLAGLSISHTAACTAHGEPGFQPTSLCTESPCPSVKAPVLGTCPRPHRPREELGLRPGPLTLDR